MPPTVTIDAEFLRRAYDGPDPDGFARFVGRAATDPAYLVVAERPDVLGIIQAGPAPWQFRTAAWGHHLHGSLSLLEHADRFCRERQADVFFYPVALGRPNTQQLVHVLTGRHGFTPYQVILRKVFAHD